MYTSLQKQSVYHVIEVIPSALYDKHFAFLQTTIHCMSFL